MSDGAPNPYVGYDLDPSPPPGSAPGASGGTPAWGTPSAARSTATSGRTTAATPPPTRSAAPTPVPPPSTPPGFPSTRRGRPAGGRSRTGCLVRAMVPVVLVAVVFIVFASRGGLLETDPDDLPLAWSVSPNDVGGGHSGGPFRPVDGTVPGTILTTTTGWVTILEASTPGAELISLDPADGAVQWSVPMPESRCTQRTVGVDLVCLTRPAPGSPFELATVDVATGEVTERVPTALAQVPWMAVPLGDLVVTLSATGMLTAVGPDGATAWSQASDLTDLDLGYQQIDLVRYDEALLLYLGYAGTVHVSSAGVVTTLPCSDVAATPQAWVCEGETDLETVGHAPDGTVLWSGDWLDYYLVDVYQRIVPVALADNRDGTVSMIDPVTGTRGPPLDVGDSTANLAFVGDAEHPAVTAEDRVTLLAADGSRVSWQQPLDDEYLTIAGSAVVGDVLVVDGEACRGLDLATGEVRWERNWLVDDFWARDGGLLVADGFDIERYELP